MKFQIIFLLLLIVQDTYSQTTNNDDLIELAKIYHKYHASDPTDDTFERLKLITTSELKKSKEFISELIKKQNEITTKKYLTKPDTFTLKAIYTIRAVNYNLFQKFDTDNNNVVDSVFSLKIDYKELVSTYYGMLFSSITNKNRPLNMSKVNFELSEYNLNDDTEKGIFFLKSMETFGMLIWGYMNVPQPPNYKNALKIIKAYPTYNGRPYYEYKNLDITDFLVKIDKSQPKESFKSYYLKKYLNTVVSHSICLMQKKRTYKHARLVISKSIVPNEDYWQYSDDPEFFEKTFKNSH